MKFPAITYSIFIFFVGLIFFSTVLPYQEITGFEARFYVFALEMWRHGVTAFPTTYRVPYPDYPVTSTWLIYIFSKILGGLSRWSAIFPSACLGALTLVATFHIGLLRDLRWGVAAVLFLLLTNTFVIEARTISLDQAITLITVLCFYIVYLVSLTQKNVYLWWLPLLLVCGFAFRGPLGVIVPTGVICTFYLLEGNFKRVVLSGVMALFLLLICSAIFLSVAYHVGGKVFVEDVIRMQVGSRIQDAHMPPIYFYWKESILGYALTFPLAILVWLSVFKKKINADIALLQKLFGWVVIILVGLSIPADKKLRYVLPMAPALALICGYLWVVPRQEKVLFFLKKCALVFCSFFPIVSVIFLFLLRNKLAFVALPFYPLLIWFLCLQIIALQKKIFLNDYFPLAIAALVFFTANVFIMDPVIQQLNRTREFVLNVESMRHAANKRLVFYHQGKDGLPIKYLVNMPVEEMPVFVESLEQVKKSDLVIASVEDFYKLPPAMTSKLIIVDRGNIGREPMVVFYMWERVQQQR